MIVCFLAVLSTPFSPLDLLELLLTKDVISPLSFLDYMVIILYQKSSGV